MAARLNDDVDDDAKHRLMPIVCQFDADDGSRQDAGHQLASMQVHGDMANIIMELVQKVLTKPSADDMPPLA